MNIKNYRLEKVSVKVAALEAVAEQQPLAGNTGIAHTRWATHGKPSTINSHPHTSNGVSVVHNGIIENHDQLRKDVIALGYEILSETDSEVIGHLVHHQLKSTDDLRTAVQHVIAKLEGAYALGVIVDDQPHTIIGARSGSPLVVGLGIDEHFIASDQMALRQVTDRFIFLEEGDLVELSAEKYSIYDVQGNSVKRSQQQLR